MAKTRVQKEAHLQEFTDLMGRSKGVVLANYQGLSMEATDALRAKCREQGITMMASKKTLVGKVLKDAGYDVDASVFKGGVAAFFGMTDEVAPAQVVAEFAKKNTTVSIYGGVLEGAFIDAAKVTALAKLPSKQQLLGQLVGTLNAPVSGFVNVLAGNLRGLVTVMNAIKEAKA